MKRVWGNSEARLVAHAQEWKCAHCGLSLDAAFELDHRKALADGGDNELTNAQALCSPCHGTKTHQELARWRDARREAIIAAKAAAAAAADSFDDLAARPHKRRRKKPAPLRLPGLGEAVASGDTAFLTSALLRFAYAPPTQRHR
tara:strand:+ start:58 stop:492 length:435 start_codon:yes stop_codon:yes gene_type:complete